MHAAPSRRQRIVHHVKNERAIQLLLVIVVVLIAWLQPFAGLGGDQASDGPGHLLWSDEFNGPAGSEPDPAVWGYDLGASGWGHHEVQEYTQNRANSELDGLGHLVITLRRNADGSVTSARLTSKGKKDFGFGLLEARIKVPTGQGLHPAFWMIGSNIKTVGWVWAGEIDIMEHINHRDDIVTALHGPPGPDQPELEVWGQVIRSFLEPSQWGDFHVFGMRRIPGTVIMYIDGVEIGRYVTGKLNNPVPWVYDNRMFALLNIAAGGDWPGPMDATTPNPAQMVVDWVRFYQ